MDSTTVNFRYDTAQFSLQYPAAIDGMPVTNLRKLLKYMLSDRSGENMNAVRVTHRILADRVAEAKREWADASAEYVLGYINTQFDWCRDKRKTEANNRKLTAAVKRTKTAHERAQKLLTFFEENKTKYCD